MATTISERTADEEVIALEATVPVPPIEGAHASASGRGDVDLTFGPGTSLTTATDSLRRKRIGQAAVFFTAFYVVLCVWNLFTQSTAHWYITPPFALRALLALVVAGLALSPLALTRGSVKALEAALFGGLMFILCLVQYNVNMEYLERDEPLSVIAYAKNGMIQCLFLMIVYGMVMPNDARTTAVATLSMAMALLTTYVVLVYHPNFDHVVSELRRGEPLGTNAVIVLVGAGLAIYGAHIVNGLRTELHEARRFGQYKLGKKLGEGGMGEVYLAEHQLLKRPAALKLIRPGERDNAVALARFEREVQSAAQLAHPNTIEIYDYGHTTDGTFYYVMEFLPGMSLEEIVQRFGPLPASRLIYLMRQVCAGLAEAHRLSIVHRDLKPSNIFVALRGGESDVAKILDFGLVKLTQDPNAPSLTADQTVSGTPLYMSPEQARGEAWLDHRSDIYSLGSIAYFALTGKPPFQGDTPMSVMIAHARDAVVPPSALRDDVPRDVEAVIIRCLSKSPDDRFQDARELSQALAACGAASEWDEERADAWWVDAARADRQPDAAAPPTKAL